MCRHTAPSVQVKRNDMSFNGRGDSLSLLRPTALYALEECSDRACDVVGTVIS